MEAVKGSEKPVVQLGGKSATLSPSSVFSVANGISDFNIDSSSLIKATGSQNSSSATTKYRFSIPDCLTEEEARASVLVFLNKLLLSSTSIASINTISDNIRKLRCLETLDYEIDVSSSDYPCVDYSVAVLDAISAVLDYRCSGFVNVVDAVACLSCEAIRAGVSAFNVMDSGDGSSAKDEVAVAADCKVFLNDSKLVNFKGLDDCVSDIPAIHGQFREVCRALHSSTRVGLKSGFKVRSANVVSNNLATLARVVFNLVESSLGRVGLVLDSIPSVEIRSILVDHRPNSLESLKRIVASAQAFLLEKDYVQSAHEVSCLVDEARNVFSWEATVAFVSLEGHVLLIGNIPKDVPPVGDDKKSEKKKDKKKKIELGKGSRFLMEFIKETLLYGDSNNDDAPALLERWFREFVSLLDPKEFRYEGLLKKVKHIVESNDSLKGPKRPKGTRDFAKGDMVIRERAFNIVEKVFKRHGATALDTPVFELRDTLTGKYGEDSKLIFDLADQGGELCSLRYDLTVPFARYMATTKDLTSFRRYQIGKVYRRDNPSEGRYREFYQCDFDIAGQSEYEKMGPDFEVLRILTELLNELQIGDYEVKVNHRKLLDGMLAICDVPPEKFRTICSSIDKLDKQPFEQIKKEMVDVKGLKEETADKIGVFVSKRGSPLDLLRELKTEGSKFLENAESSLALNELEILFKALDKSNCIDKMVFDLSLARGLDYYTGIIFEAVFKGSTEVGSIAAGGRYDNLIGMFGTKSVPAVGVSLGIERVFLIIEKLNTEKAIRSTESDVLVSILGNDLLLGVELVSKLWDADIKAEFMIDQRMKKHEKRFNESGIPWRVLMGDKEQEAQIVKLKNAKKEEFDVPVDGFVEEVKRRLQGRV